MCDKCGCKNPWLGCDPKPFTSFYMVRGDAHTPQSMWDYVLCITAEQEAQLRKEGFIKSTFKERY